MPADDTLKSLFYDLERGLPQTRREALHQLRRHPTPEVIATVISTLRTDANTQVRVAAAECLAAFGDPSAIPALLSALQDEERTLRHAALATLRTLLDEDTLRLRRLTRRTPDPEIRQEAAKQVTTLQATPRPRGPRLDPAQRWGTEILTELCEHRTPASIRLLCALLDDEETHPHYRPLLRETLLRAARRHPTIDLRPVYETLQKQALSARSPAGYRSHLRELAALIGAALPIPAETAPCYQAVLPVPASSALPAQTDIPSDHPLTLQPDPTSIFEQSVPRHPQAWLMMGCLMGLALCLGWVISILPHVDFPKLLLTPGVLPLAYFATNILIKGSAALMHIPRYVLPTESVRCVEKRFTVIRRLSPFRWQARVDLPPGTRVHCVAQEKSPLERFFSADTPPSRHLAILGAKGKALRFAHGRQAEDLERLAAEINAYLEQQEGGIQICDPPSAFAVRRTASVTVPETGRRCSRRP